MREIEEKDARILRDMFEVFKESLMDTRMLCNKEDMSLLTAMNAAMRGWSAPSINDLVLLLQVIQMVALFAKPELVARAQEIVSEYKAGEDE